jgi:type IV pilus assembly protein PilW
MQRGCDPAVLAPKRRFVSYIYWVRDFAAEAGDGVPTLVRSEFDNGPGGLLAHRDPVPLVEGIDGLWVELGIDRISITNDFVRNRDPIEWDDDETKQRAINRGDGVPDVFVRCNPECTGLPPAVGDAAATPLDDLTNVTAVKLYVLARSREATPGYRDTKTYSIGAAGMLPAFNDGFKRHVYSTTVRLPNVSGRRERP